LLNGDLGDLKQKNREFIMNSHYGNVGNGEGKVEIDEQATPR